MYTVGRRRIVHSRMIIHRSPSLRFRPRIPWILREARSPLPREFCSFASRQAGYCRIPLRDLPRLVEASKLEESNVTKMKVGSPFMAARFSAIFLRDLENDACNDVSQSALKLRTYVHRVNLFPVVPLRCTSFVFASEYYCSPPYSRQYGSYYLGADI